jgi:hypothetical protein
MAKAITIYLEQREKARAAAKKKGLAPDSFGSAQKMAPVRNWLRGVAVKIDSDYPGFDRVFDLLFDHELTQDD